MLISDPNFFPPWIPDPTIQFLNRYRKTLERIDKERILYISHKNRHLALRNMGWGSGNRKILIPAPDPVVNKAPNPGSATQSLIQG